MGSPRKVLIVPASIARTHSRWAARAGPRPAAVATHRQARGWFAPATALAMLASGLFVLAAPAAAQDRDRGSQVDTTHQVRTFDTTPHADPDSAVIFGDAVNPGPWPIVRHGPAGEEIKDVGSSVWRPLRGKTEADLREEARARWAEKIRLYGHLLLDAQIAVRDSADLKLLASLGDTVLCAPPCTTSVRIPLRHFGGLRDAGVSCWERRKAPPDPSMSRERSRPAKADLGPTMVPPAGPLRSPGSALESAPLPIPPPRPDSGGGGTGPPRAALAPTGVLIFSEGFETNTVPGSVWSATDYN